MSTLSQPSETPKTDQAKIEYDRLIAYFKLLVWITGALFGLVIAAAGILLFKSTADIQTQLSATRDAATQQIATIKTSAQDTAKSEAQKAIDAAFEKQNVQRVIETAAQRKVDMAVEASVQRNLGARIEAFRNLVNEIGEISNHGAQLRLGFRSGLDYLLKTRDETSDPTVKAYASSTVKLIAADYEKGETMFRSDILDDPNRFFLAAAPTPRQLMAVIKNPGEVYSARMTAWAFLDMKKRVGWDVPMFDIPAAEKWCAQHKPKCGE
jgi:citrate lyase gamma subunit